MSTHTRRTLPDPRSPSDGAALGPGAAHAQCTVTIGVVMELTGPAGQFGQAGAKSVELAFRDLNEAGGPAGCRLAAEIRDSQSQGSVAVDVAKQLVEIKRVPAIIGGIISSVSIPILTSVTAPSGIVQISPASSSPTLTNLGARGQERRLVLPDDHHRRAPGRGRRASTRSTLGSSACRVIHVNNDFGVNMVREFTKAYQALGGHAHLDHALQPEPGVVPARGHEGAPGQPRRALPRQLSGRRHDHRAHVDLPGRRQEVPAERRDEHRQVHRGRRRRST